MPEVVFSVDQSKSRRDQAVPGHNRWHPDVPSAASVRPGDEFRVECREWTDAQLTNSDSSNDVRDVNLNVAHMLSGPIEIHGAEPGDLLVIDILDLGPCQPPQEKGDAPGQGWGYTGIFAKVNGGGFLTDHFPDAYKAIWDFHGQDATSRHIPGVRYTGITHPGLFGTAPSAELLAEWNRREQALIDKDPNRVPPLALPPLDEGVLAGTATGGELERIGREGARTVPARENGDLDATVAYRRACLNAVEYLRKFGYSGEQAYLLLGSAPIEGRVSGVVDIPNACCSLYLPTAIFDFDIRPNKEGPQPADRGSAAHTS